MNQWNQRGRLMEDRRNERVKDEKKKWFVPSFPVCSVWSFTAVLCWGNTSGHYKRTGSGYAFVHIRETQNWIKQRNNVEYTKCCSMQPINLSFTNGWQILHPLPSICKLTQGWWFAALKVNYSYKMKHQIANLKICFFISQRCFSQTVQDRMIVWHTVH